MEHLLTVKEPRQGIPTFADTIALLLRVSPASDMPRELILTRHSPRTRTSNSTST